ncbi:ATP-binding cassette domain-containing protein, partial [Halobacterium salinarum]|uniref:ATP-binding cassette domain-containing protein n=1 Tax=Halobacterium salinarum TaxID=2242 RepID=UPI001F2B94D1
ITTLDRVGLRDVADKKVSNFSQGMEKRLALAMAVVGSPDLLLLDEPLTSLDPYGVRLVREAIQSEINRGTTVLFSSHVLGQVELVCDRVGILYQGELIGDGSLSVLRAEVGLDPDATAEDVFVEFVDDRAARENTDR